MEKLASHAGVFRGARISSLPGKACNKGRTIRKLIGGAGEVQKKYSRKGKLNEKKFVHAN